MKKFIECAIMALIVLMCGLNCAAQSHAKIVELKITVTDETGDAYEDKYEIQCDLTDAADGSEIKYVGMLNREEQWLKAYIENPEKHPKVKARIWLGKSGQQTGKQPAPAEGVEEKTIEVDLSEAKLGAPCENVYIHEDEDVELKKGIPLVPYVLEVAVTLAHTK